MRRQHAREIRTGIYLAHNAENRAETPETKHLLRMVSVLTLKAWTRTIASIRRRRHGIKLDRDRAYLAEIVRKEQEDEDF